VTKGNIQESDAKNSSDLNIHAPRRYSARESLVTTTKLCIGCGILLLILWMSDVLITG